MTWPSSDVPTTALDGGTDTPPRSVFLAWAQAFNQMRNHVTEFAQTLLGSADQAAARNALDVPSRSGGNASGIWGIAISGSAATASTATNCVRSVQGSGLASGGGVLNTDRIIAVPGSTQVQAEEGLDNATAMTPLRTAQAIAVLANPLPAIAAAAVGAPGTYAMLRYGGDATHGTIVSGSLLAYASVNSSGVAYSGTPDGTWMLCGYTQNGRASEWKRVS